MRALPFCLAALAVLTAACSGNTTGSDAQPSADARDASLPDTPSADGDRTDATSDTPVRFDAGTDTASDVSPRFDAGTDATGDAATCSPWTGDIARGAGCPDGEGPTATGQPPYSEVLDSGVAVEHNVTYAMRSGVVLQGDLYHPSVRQATPPGILVVVHGGGWHCGRRRAGVAWWAEAVAQRLGIGTFNIEYLQVEEGGQYPENLMQVKCAMQFIAENAQGFDLDGTRVGVAGESAGAHLATLAAVTADRTDLDPHCGRSPARPVITAEYSGPMDLPTWPMQTGIDPTLVRQALLDLAVEPCPDRVLACDPGRSCNRCLDASPSAHACTSSGRILLINAPTTFDSAVSFEQADTMYRLLSDARARVQLVAPTEADLTAAGCNTTNGAHGWTNTCLDATSSATVDPLLSAALGGAP